MSMMIKILDQWQEIERLRGVDQMLQGERAQRTYYQAAHRRLVNALQTLIAGEGRGLGWNVEQNQLMREQVALQNSRNFYGRFHPSQSPLAVVFGDIWPL